MTREIVNAKHPSVYDLNEDNVVDDLDLDIWVKVLEKTWYGDANLDG